MTSLQELDDVAGSLTERHEASIKSGQWMGVSHKASTYKATFVSADETAIMLPNICLGWNGGSGIVRSVLESFIMQLGQRVLSYVSVTEFLGLSDHECYQQLWYIFWAWNLGSAVIDESVNPD
jgi:hypothetical protein